ncbi:Macro domain-containing protein [Meloidogyne graminicola]|uniref:Macro domain-containing protein n=1 Tax=Meloidogyne graminicola TaxID=189291 RepID=A0A8S9ZNH8_9BILA|nr:Macro domain-containing protein [Meloidogyne graminicola]
MEEGNYRRNKNNIWSKALEQINLLRRQQLGSSFSKLVWDNKLAKRLSNKDYNKMKPLAIPITNPNDGIIQNLQYGMESIFQAILRRYIQCEKKTENCFVQQNLKYRIPVELIDSNAKRIGCTARMFKKRGMVKLEFDAVCITEKENDIRVRNDNIILFKINQIQNSRLRRKLIVEAKNTQNNNDRYEVGDWEEENKWNKNGRNDWSDEIQFEEIDENEEEDIDDFNERNTVGNRYGRDIDLKIKAERGDILEAKVDVIINPTRPSLSIDPLNGEEAIPKVLRAKSVFDVVDVKDRGSLDRTRMFRVLTKLAKMVEPSDNLKQKEKAMQAKRKIQQWQQMVNNDQKWNELMEESENLSFDNYNNKKVTSISERIVQAGGPILAKKLKQIAQEKGGLPVGDAFSTESFQIGVNYFAKKIIHTVPPVVLQTQEDKEKLADCYKRTLNLAIDLEMKKIAFPEMLSIKSDENSRMEAAKIGLETIKKWIEKNKEGKAKQLKSIVFCVDQTLIGFYLENIKKIFKQ